MTNNRILIFTAPILALLEALRSSLSECNALGGYFEREAGGAYGATRKALINATACAIAHHDQDPIFFGDAVDIATALYSLTVDSGINMTEAIAAWNEGVIDSTFRI
jgi:hypothetical protein